MESVSKGTILYYGGFILPDQNAAANRVRASGLIFKEMGFDVVFLGVSASETTSGISPVPEMQNAFQISHPSSALDWLKRIWKPSELLKLAESITDLCMIILYNVPYSTVAFVKKWYRNTQVKVVYDCTEWSDYTDGSFLKKAYKKFDCYYIENQLANAVDGIIAVSKMMKKKYEKKSPTVILPPLVDLSDAIWHQQKYHDESYTFCFSGLPDGNKENIDNIIRAFKSLNIPNTKLKMVGINSTDVICSDSDGIEFLGIVSHAESIKNILSCDCFIFLRPNDKRNNAGFPTKFAEAYTCGVPIITTKISDMPDYESNSVICCDDCNVGTIKQAMTKIYSLKHDQQLSAAFDYHSYEEQICNWIKEI